MATLSDGKKTITISAESEDEEIENTVAQYPVQSGNLVTDHTQRASIGWKVEGKLYGKNHNEINNSWNQLVAWQYNGDRIFWNGAISHRDIIIEKVSKSYRDGGFENAVWVTLELKEAHIVSTSFVKVQHVGPVKPTPPPSPPQAWVTVRPGNTYWGWWRQYGTPIQTLRNWNHWPDRFIPVGARARVK